MKEICESGTILEARLSAELLLAIFMPRSPMHDGAVIVREDLIEAAGCFLPLAEQSLAERRVGTRHRAALGLSEQTDAVVVVVSEETGAITIARDGKFTRPVEDEARLVKMLLAITRPPRRERRLARNDLISHLRSRLLTPRARTTRFVEKPRAWRSSARTSDLKLLSITLAIVGWAYFRYATNPIVADGALRPAALGADLGGNLPARVHRAFHRPGSRRDGSDQTTGNRRSSPTRSRR